MRRRLRQELTSGQRYWGTEKEWLVHRRGLQLMIEARGGVEVLERNWRLGSVLRM